MELRKTHVLALGLVTLAGSQARADLHPSMPGWSSRPGAAYTLYLDMTGFNFNGTWGGGTPGSQLAYYNVPNNGAFNSTQLGNLKKLWASVAERYSAYNINVTTLDPAIAAGQAATDAQRQSYYDATKRVQHTVVGGTNSWFGSAGGVSYVGVTQNSYPNSGLHTNWVFYDGTGGYWDYTDEAVAHENGHALGLNHQGDYKTDGTKVQEYSTNNNASGNGSYAPIIGVTYYSQRGLWADGRISSGFQNDVKVILNNNGMGGFMGSGIGHTFAAATNLSVASGVLDAGTDKGLITPVDAANPNAIGVDSYTKDFFKFHSTGGSVNLHLNFGNELIQTGVADPGAMLDGTLDIFNSSHQLIASGVHDLSTLRVDYSGNLAAGDYYAQIASIGGYQWDNNGQYINRKFFTMGSYFLTGNGAITATPEPASLIAIGMGALALLRRRQK